MLLMQKLLKSVQTRINMHKYARCIKTHTKNYPQRNGFKKLQFQYSDSEFPNGIIEIHGTLYERFDWIFKSVGIIVFRIWNSLINPTKYKKMLKMEMEWFIWAIVLCASLTASISKESIVTYCYWCVANSLLSFDIIRHFQFSCHERFYFVLFSTMNSSQHWKKNCLIRWQSH